MRMAVARSLSILGHPLLVMPVAALLAMRAHGADVASTRTLMIVLGSLGLALLVYSSVQVRRGHWQHIDASQPIERRRLNGVLLLVLGGATLWAFVRQGWTSLTVASGAAAMIVVAALLLSRWLKLSLHVAFGVFAAFLPGPGWAALGLATLAAAVAWSRWVLQRHTPRDLLAGTLVGAMAGLLVSIA